MLATRAMVIAVIYICELLNPVKTGCATFARKSLMLWMLVGKLTSCVAIRVNSGMYSLKRVAMITPMITAMSEPGTTLIFFRKYVFHITITMSEMIPMISAFIAILCISRQKCLIFIPSITGNCLMISVIPIAASIPLMTDVGTNFATLLALRTPKRICIAPAMISERRNVGKPRFPIVVMTIATSPAAGPETLRGDLLKRPTRIPPRIPAISPLKRGAPLAIAIPRHSGTATKKTAIPAGKSCFRHFNIFTFYI